MSMINSRGKESNLKEEVQSLMKALNILESHYAIGKTKIFLQSEASRRLHEHQQLKLEIEKKAARALSSSIMSMSCRVHFLCLKHSTRHLQSRLMTFLIRLSQLSQSFLSASCCLALTLAPGSLVELDSKPGRGGSLSGFGWRI
eukprot:751738-Hanusia_phi.AAC.3